MESIWHKRRNTVNQTFVVAALTVLLVIVPPITLVVGIHSESERLYDKCLTANSEQPYSKAIAFCKEQVK